jgi:hypothetical protein
MRRDGEMADTLDDRIDGTLRTGVTSTAAARERVMAAVRASARPVRGGGDAADISVIAPLRASRPLWRSPAGALLAAASIAGVIALVRAVAVDGPIPDVPGQHTARRHAGDQGRPETVAPAAGGPTTATRGSGSTRVAKVQFVYVAPKARKVVVVGDFNDWDPAAAPLKATSGVWSGEVDVPFGRHDYAFVVDGDHWVRDPSAPQAPADEFGTGYSVIVVGDHLGEHR